MSAETRLLRWLTGALAAILSVTAIDWFLRSFERRTTEVDTGYSAAARRNPFLAAEAFLGRLDVPAQSLAGRDLLRKLPAPGDTLVVKGLGALNAQRRAALHAWLEQGGRLIVEATRTWDDPSSPPPDDFLARYGARLRDIGPSAGGFSPREEVVARVELEDYPYPVEVGFLPRYYLEDLYGQARGAVAAADRLRLLQYRVGEGLLTVTSDNRFLTNSAIGHHDHALFFALLADWGGEGKVWLLYDSAMPWLGAILWREAPLAVISALCLIGAFLWHLGGRLGPTLPAPTPGRRDLLAHLQASADLFWRTGVGDRLSAMTRERIEQSWLRRYPTLRRLDGDARAAWIGNRAGMTPTEVKRGLYPGDVAADTLAEGALLQRLCSALAAGAGTRRSPMAPGVALHPPPRDGLGPGSTRSSTGTLGVVRPPVAGAVLSSPRSSK
jgi:hypothetical protein